MVDRDHPEPLTDASSAIEPTYKVGHGRPPLATRFQKGQSGNPKGRPKGSLNSQTILTRVLDEKVTVRNADGRTRRMTKREVGLTKAANRFAETGDLKALEAFTRLENPLAGKRGKAGPPRDAKQQSDSDLAMLDWFLKASTSPKEK